MKFMNGDDDMFQELSICFELEDKVENMTDLHKRLVDLLGVGGMVERDINGQVTDFRILFEYGTIALNTHNDALELNVKEMITLEQIQGLYKKLKDAIAVNRCYLKKNNVYEI